MRPWEICSHAQNEIKSEKAKKPRRVLENTQFSTKAQNPNKKELL